MSTGAGDPRPSRSRLRRLLLHLPAAAVVAVGLSLTGLFSAASNSDYHHSERDLTNLQVRLAAAALTEAASDVERHLDPAAVAAAAGARDFNTLIDGARSGSQFTGAVLVSLVGGTRVVASVGSVADPPPSPQALQAIDQARARGTLGLVRILGPGMQRLGYAMVAAGPAGRYAVYAEQGFPADRKVTVNPTGPAAGLYLALYYGAHQTRQGLIETNARSLPLPSPQSSQSFPFGAATLTLSVSPKGTLQEGFAAQQTSIIAVGGTLITALVAVLVEVLALRRRRAEQQAASSRRIAETLQRSLLPTRLPEPPGMQLAARYHPATAGITVGGDWYDAAEVDGMLFFSVGDVAGHGLEAASLMGRLRAAISAYVADATPPAEMLTKLSRLMESVSDGTFATVVCGSVEPASGRLLIANAGHPQPVLVEGGDCRVLETPVGPPVGVGEDYLVHEVTLPPGTTLLAYTDGLIERRGESITAGQERLCRSAQADVPLEPLLDRLLAELLPEAPSDDVAVLGIRLTSRQNHTTFPPPGSRS